MPCLPRRWSTLALALAAACGRPPSEAAPTPEPQPAAAASAPVHAPASAAAPAPASAAPASASAPASAPAPAAPWGCPVQVSRPEIEAEIFDSWVALWNRMSDPYPGRFNQQPPGAELDSDISEADIRRKLGTSKGSGPWLWHQTDPDGLHEFWHLIGQQPGGKLVLFHQVAEHHAARCQAGTLSATLKLAPVPHVIFEGLEQEPFTMCQKQNGTQAPCNGEAGEIPKQSSCGPGIYTITTDVYDMAAGKVLLRTEESGTEKKRPSVSVTVEKDGVVLAGSGCSGKQLFKP